MKRDKREGRKRIRRKAEGEDELIFNNGMSWKPFSFQPSVAINNRAREIKWLHVCVCVSMSVGVCVSLILSHMCVSRDRKGIGGRRRGEKNKELRMVGVCVFFKYSVSTCS